jgi:hypothetical protein
MVVQPVFLLWINGNLLEILLTTSLFDFIYYNNTIFIILIIPLY